MEEILQLSPSDILADSNSRHGLKRSRLDQLKKSVMELGGVQEAITVEPIDIVKDGSPSYRLVKGFYRHRAVEELNKDGAGLTLPTVIRTYADSATRLRAQLAENMEREGQSPMDMAVAIKKLMDEGVSRADIRQMFARPASNGKKGVSMAPASNAWINIILSFLNLPKPVQTLIHEGVIGIKAAYQLSKVSPDKRQEVIDKALEAFTAEIEAEAKEEERYLKGQQRIESEAAKVQKASEELAMAREEAEQAEKLIADKTTALRAVQAEPLGADPKLATERLKGAENDLKAAQGNKKKAANKLATILTKQREAEEGKKEAVKEAPAKPKAKPAKATKGISDKQVKKAAKSSGENTGAVALNASEIKQVLKDLQKDKEPKKVQLIGVALASCFSGQSTTKQLIADLTGIVGAK